MDRFTFAKKTGSNQRPRVDRFIPPRDSFADIMRRRSWHCFNERHSASATVRTYSEYIQQKKYTNYLDKAFGLESLRSQDSGKQETHYVQPWPCAPRKKQFLSSADSILDLPIYSDVTFPELLDWSSDNILVAALGKMYHLWSWDSQSLVNIGYIPAVVLCCRFEPRGKMLALGMTKQIVEIHDSTLCKSVARYYCRSGHARMTCAVSAIDWSPTGNSLATGCTEGHIMALDRRARVLSWGCWGNGEAIQTVKISPDARFLVAKILDRNVVPIFTWPDLAMYTVLYNEWTVKAITWHPWRSALLTIGCDGPHHKTKIVLWDAHGVSLRSLTISPMCLVSEDHSLDTMLFSHRTGELVVSLWNSGRSTSYPEPCSLLLVLSDPETVVDQFGEGLTTLGRVRTMIFSPDGSKLATATIEEDLIIWNFLPEDKSEKTKHKLKRFCSMPVLLDQAGFGHSVR